jgi:hypothetical protein
VNWYQAGLGTSRFIGVTTGVSDAAWEAIAAPMMKGIAESPLSLAMAIAIGNIKSAAVSLMSEERATASMRRPASALASLWLYGDCTSAKSTDNNTISTAVMTTSLSA